MGTTRYTDYKPVNWDIPIWRPDWNKVDSLLTNQEQGYQLAEQALNAPIDSSSYGNDPLIREQLRLNREQAQSDLASTYVQKGVNAGNKALQGYITQLQREKNPGGVEYQLMQNKAAISGFNDKINKAEGWSPEQKQQWFALNMSNYKGSIQGDDLKGFSGQDISKFIDLSEKARKLMKEMIPTTTEGFMDSNGKVVLNTGGKMVYSGNNGQDYFWDKAKTIKLTPEEMITAVLPSLKSDAEAQAYLTDKQKIKLFSNGVTESTYKPILETKKTFINDAISKIDNAKTDNDKKQLISSLSGLSIDNLKKYKTEDLNGYLQKYKSQYELEQLKINNITSYNDLIKSESDDDLQKIVKDNSKIYERDDFLMTPEHWLNQFALEALKDSYKIKAEADKQQKEGFNKDEMWMEEGFVAHEKMPFDIKSVGDYDKLVTSFNNNSKEIAKQYAIMNYQYNTELKDPKNPTGQLLREAGWNPEKDGDFIQFKTDSRTGITSIEKTNWDKLNVLDSGKQQKINEINKNFEKAALDLNSMKSKQLAYIQLYQKHTGDIDIINNLKDYKENVLVNPKDKISNSVLYKQINELIKPSSFYDSSVQQQTREQAIKELFPNGKPYRLTMFDQEHITHKQREIYDKQQAELLKSNITNNYDKYVANKKKKGETPFSLQDLLNPKKYGEQEFIKNISSKDLGKNLNDLTYEQKKDKYNDEVESLNEVQLTPGRSYFISPIAFTDSKMKKVARETNNEMGQIINNAILNYGSEGKFDNLYYLDGFTPINNKDEMDRIAKGLAQFKPDDIEDESKNAQGDKVRYSIRVVNGKMYGVASINFDEKQNLNGKNSYSTNVMFEINDNHQGLKNWIIQDQRLLSEQSLKEQNDTWSDLETTSTSIKNYQLPSSKVNVNITRKIDVSDNSTGYYQMDIFPNTSEGNNGLTSRIAKVDTNNPYLGIEIKDYAHQLSVRKNELATIKAMQYNGNDNAFRDFIMKEVQEKAGGKINETTLNSIYEWIIKPEIKDGKVLDVGNFQSPQQSLIQFK